MKPIRRVTLILLTVDVALIALHVLLGGRFDLFNLDHERNFPSYFSGGQLIFIAAMSLGTLFLVHTRFQKILLGFNAFFFLMLGFDEISELHENVTYYLVKFVKPFGFLRTLTYMWLIFFAPFIVAGFAFFVLFLKKIIVGVTSAAAPFIAGVCCFAAAISLELGSGLIRNKLFHRFEIPIEEGFEMVGATLILASLLLVAGTLFEKTFQRRI